MAHARGQLEADGVWVRDHQQASRLWEKGSYGARHGAELALDLLEAAYLVEADRLEVTSPDGTLLPIDELLARGTEAGAGFETAYLAYRDYRSRGYVLRQGEHGEFDGWARGAAPPRQKPNLLIAPRAEGASAAPGQLADLVGQAHGLGRGLLVSVVDEESDVTYYEVGRAEVHGHLPDPAPEHAATANARLLDDRAILLDVPDVLVQAGYGNEAGGHRFLSLAETHHLAQNGMPVGGPDGQELAPRAILERARTLDPDGQEVLSAYTWLRELDLAPKTGLKFGVHYRVYKGKPGDGHAPFLVQAMAPEAELTYRGVARLVRLAHSVKKRGILWSPEGAITVTWTRP